MKSILGKSPAELRRELEREGIEGYRAAQILRWIFQRGVRDFADMSDLSRALRERLAASWTTRSLTRAEVLRSRDGTAKLALATGDGARIESVIIPEEDRRTLCVSSQVGCSLDCTFCATGRLGFGRNLRADEIADQLLHANEVLAPRGERVTHVVFMGMGEPLLNLREVVPAIRVLTDPDAAGLSSRKVTVSTAGVVPKMAELGLAVKTRLAVSLHATTDEVRTRLVPLNRRFPIAELLDACRRYPVPRRDRISFEYTLIRDVNDTPEDARRLVGLLHGLRAKVNLIPMNEHPGAPYRRPEPERMEAFMATVAKSRTAVSIRRSRGDDVFAACGQLANLPPHAPAAAREEHRNREELGDSYR